MGHSASGTAAREAGAAGQQPPSTVRLAGMLTLSCRISDTGQTTVTFAGELDAAWADQAYHPGPDHCGGAQAEEPRALPAGPAGRARILLLLTRPRR